MVTSPTGKGVIVMGGFASGVSSKAMFELSASMQWTRLEQTLQIHHKWPLAIPIPSVRILPIPNELVNEKVEAKTKRRKLQYK